MTLDATQETTMETEICRAALEAAWTRVRELRAALELTAAALADAQSTEADKLKILQQSELDLESALDRPAYEAASASLESVKVDYVLAVKATKAREDAHTQALESLKAGQAAVENAVDGLLESEKPIRHARFQYLVDQLIPVAEEIAAYMPDGFNKSPEFDSGLSPVARRILDTFTRVADPINTSIQVLQGGPTWRYEERYRARRARLIAGESDLADA